MVSRVQPISYGTRIEVRSQDSEDARSGRPQPTYKDLHPGATRLVLLKSSNNTEQELEIQLYQVRYSDLIRGRYEALSYHWGYETANKPVFISDDCDDLGWHLSSDQDMVTTRVADAELDKFRKMNVQERMLKQNHFTVTKNLYEALLSIRHKKFDQKLWIDALSINQENDDEKTQQVARIDEVYYSAKTVYIWLCPGDSRTSLAIHFLRGELLKNPKKIREYVNDEENMLNWQALSHLMRRSWFCRRWVIQELALARDAVAFCGQEEIHWNDLRDGISIFADNFDTIRNIHRGANVGDHNKLGESCPMHAKRLVDITSHMFREHRTPTGIQKDAKHGFEYLVSNLSAYNTADPRDTINCFRNIAKETSKYRHKIQGTMAPVLPQLDYKDDLLTTYTKFVHWVVRQSRSLDILCRRWAIPEKSKEERRSKSYPPLRVLPSWILTVDEVDRQVTTSGGRRHGDSFVGTSAYPRYKASSGLKVYVTFSLPGFSPIDTRYGSASNAPDAPSAQQSSFLPKIPLVKEPEETAASTVTTSLEVPTASPRISSTTNGNLTPRPDQHHRRNISVNSTPDPRDYSNPAHLHRMETDVLRQYLSEPNIDASIRIQGIKVGSIRVISQHTHDGVIARAVFNALLDDPSFHSGNRVPDRLWRTLVAERGPDGDNPPPIYARACQYAMLKRNDNDDLNVKSLLIETSTDFMKPFLRRVEAVIWNRCFFSVEQDTKDDDYFGFGPETALDEDILCILGGCSVPVVLRPRRHKIVGEYYRFIGEAYVYGIMEGEFVEQTDPAKSEIFRIF